MIILLLRARHVIAAEWFIYLAISRLIVHRNNRPSMSFTGDKCVNETVQ